MAESGLSIGASDLRAEIGFFLGYGRTSANWSAAQLSEINGIMQSGVRRVYYPLGVAEDILGYEWSWLRPTTTLSISVAGGYDYDLPDDFGRLIGGFHYPLDEYRADIIVVSVGKLLAMRAYSDLEDAPKYVAIRFKDSDGTTGQRQEALFYPTPNASWTLSYEYEAYSGALSDSYPYPLGGMQLAELYIESCLAVAEGRFSDELGQHNQQYTALLQDAVARDRKRGPRFFGQFGHVESIDQARLRHGDTGSSYDILYKTITY